jgi:hypothetical protein
LIGVRDSPSGTSSTNDRNRYTGETDEDVDVLNDDTQQSEDRGGRRVIGSANAVAALDRASVAFAGRLVASTNWCGGRKGSKSSESDNAELHNENEKLERPLCCCSRRCDRRKRVYIAS